MSDMDQTRVMGSPTMAGMDRTMVAPNLTGGGDMNRTQVGGVTTCPVCKSATPLGEMYCGDCGFLLSSTPAEAVEAPVELAPAAELVDVTDGRRYRLRAGLNTIGRQGTDILVMEGTVSRNHATLTVENGLVLIEDLGSSNGTKVGDRRIGPNQPTPATHGTPLKFGNWRAMLEIMGGEGAAAVADRTVVVSSEEKTVMAPLADRTMVGVPTAPETPSPVPDVAPPVVAPEPPAPSGPVIALLKMSKGTGSDIPVTEETVTIGRKAGNTIVLSDSYISGKHAEITTDNTGTYLTDVGSTNGTVVNGQKLAAHEKQLLLDGDEVQLGQNTYLFSLADADAEEAQPDALETMPTAPVEMPSLAPETTDEE
jgi:pSer/pThr/pTyr-binding forkhead associated (FHA) protein